MCVALPCSSRLGFALPNPYLSCHALLNITIHLTLPHPTTYHITIDYDIAYHKVIYPTLHHPNILEDTFRLIGR